MLEKKIILNVGITNATKHEVLEYIIKGLEKKGKKYFIITPNPEILVLAHKAKTYNNILNNAEIALPDGVGVIIAGKILGIRLKGRVTGVELLESLCLAVSEKPITVGFLGGRDGVAEKTAECLVGEYTGLNVVFVGQEWVSSYTVLDGYRRTTQINTPQSNAAGTFDVPRNNAEKASVNQRFDQGKSASIDILFVAFGAPKQEMWISENLDKLPVKVAIGVGGAFDYISGRVPRAPVFVRKIGLEWLFRLLVQPWRFKRQLALLEFVFLVLKEKFLPRHSGKSR